MKNIALTVFCTLIIATVAYTVYGNTDREIKTIEVPEGVITEVTEITESVAGMADSPSQMSNDGETAVFTHISELADGIVTETIEIVGAQSDFGSQLVEAIDVELEIIEINTEEGVIPIAMAVNKSLASQTTFWDTVYAPCGSGAEFKFSTNQGNVYYLLQWEGGYRSGVITCPSTCHVTITTSWSAFYTKASATAYYPNIVWGPDNAYKCR
jgi:hypothetical protein